MKKILAIILALVVALYMASCDLDMGSVDMGVVGGAVGKISTEQKVDLATATEQNQATDDDKNANIEPGDENGMFVVGDSNVYIHDDANLLNANEEKMLLSVVSKHANDMYFNILFLTYDNAYGKTTQEYGDDYMDNMFPAGVEDNIAFVIDMDNREVYINTMGKAILWLDDTDIEDALDAGWDYVTDGDWGAALVEIADYSLQIIANGGIINYT